jgi:hypothetical protein
MSYVYVGYAVVFGALALYAASLVARRRRLQRAADLTEPLPARTERQAQ